MKKVVTSDRIILDALKEDILPCGDITSKSIILDDCNSDFALYVYEDAVLSGLDVFKKVFKLLDKNITVKTNYINGAKIKRNNLIATVSGNTCSILQGERTAINFISHLSGIATCSRALVDMIKDTGVVLLDTRKTTPNLRYFEKQAVLAGGGSNHRFNLSEMVLIKNNHIDSAGGITNTINKVKEKLGNKYKIEIEVRDIKELKEAILCKPDIIMFDNWGAGELKKALRLVPENILTEASGQITLKNIRVYAQTGVKYISTSYMIKNRRWIDFSLKAIL